VFDVRTMILLLAFIYFGYTNQNQAAIGFRFLFFFGGEGTKTQKPAII